MVSAGPHTIRFVGIDPQGGDCTAFIDEVALTVEPDSLADGSFEIPVLAADSYQYQPGGSAWTFVAAAGVAANYSGFTILNPVAPDGNQVAFIQGGGSISQTAYLDAGTYNLSYLAAQRSSGVQRNSQELAVYVDGQQMGLATPSTISYGTYQTLNFTVAAGMHTIRLAGLNPAGGDNTAFVDEVTLAVQADAFSDSSFKAPSLAQPLTSTNPPVRPGSSPAAPASPATAACSTPTTPSPPPAPRSLSFRTRARSASPCIWIPAPTPSPSWPPSAPMLPSNMPSRSRCLSMETWSA